MEDKQKRKTYTSEGGVKFTLDHLAVGDRVIANRSGATYREGDKGEITKVDYGDGTCRVKWDGGSCHWAYSYRLTKLHRDETSLTDPEPVPTMQDLRDNCFPASYTWYTKQPKPISVLPHPKHDWQKKLKEVMPKRDLPTEPVRACLSEDIKPRDWKI